MSRHEWLIAFEKIGVRVFPESSFVQMLSGFLPFDCVQHRSINKLHVSSCP